MFVLPSENQADALPDHVTKAPKKLNWHKAIDVITLLSNIVVVQ